MSTPKPGRANQRAAFTQRAKLNNRDNHNAVRGGDNRTRWKPNRTSGDTIRPSFRKLPDDGITRKAVNDAQTD